MSTLKRPVDTLIACIYSPHFKNCFMFFWILYVLVRDGSIYKARNHAMPSEVIKDTYPRQHNQS